LCHEKHDDERRIHRRSSFGCLSWWCGMRWVSGLGRWPSFADVGARFLVDVVRGGAA
jgi:hypothetical protein